MPFGKFLDKATAKIQEELRKNNINIPGSSSSSSASPAGPPPVPANKPSFGSAPPPPPAQPYFQANFSPEVPVNSQVKHEQGDWGWGNNELQNYTDSPENSFHTPHGLVLRAIAGQGKYTSARLRVHHTLARQNGYLEATISAPSARGIWPAFWLLPSEPFNWPVDGEVDIMEHWNGETENHCCLHWGHFHGEDMAKHKVCETNIPQITSAHTYGFAWDQPPGGEGGRMIWYIDGRPVMKASRPAGTRRLEDFQVILNIAVGGNVNKGAVPADGVYDMCVHELKMSESVPGGQGRFESDWGFTTEGHGY
jgi:beta-glucanase (GH16 family)